MSESAPPAAEPGVTPSSLDAGKTYTEDYVNDLKAKLEAATAREATANAGLAAHKERQRMALKGMQAEVQSFVNEAYELAPEEQKHEVDPMRKFAESLGEAENPDSAMPLARVICLSSSKFKRDRRVLQDVGGGGAAGGGQQADRRPHRRPRRQGLAHHRARGACGRAAGGGREAAGGARARGRRLREV